MLARNGNEQLSIAFTQTRTILNNLHRKAEEAGLKLGYLENYFPREIKDYAGLSKFLGKEKKTALNNLLIAATKKKGSELTAVERGNVTNKFLLSTYPSSSQTTKLKKGRKIDVLPAELLK